MLPQCWVLLKRLDNTEGKPGLATVKKEPLDPDPEDSRHPKAEPLENIKCESILCSNKDDPHTATIFSQNENTRELVKVEPVLTEEKSSTGTKCKKKQQELVCTPQDDLNYVIEQWWKIITVNKETLAVSTKKNARRSLRVNWRECFEIYQCRMCSKTYESKSPGLLKHSQTHFCWVKLERCPEFAQGLVEDTSLLINYVANDDSEGEPPQDPLSDSSEQQLKKIKIENDVDQNIEVKNYCKDEEIFLPGSISCEPSPKLERDEEETGIDMKPKICEICQQIFLNELNLSEHKKLHEEFVIVSPSGEGICDSKLLVKLEIVSKFSCQFCETVFNLKSQLKEHVLTHVKPLQCTLHSNGLSMERNLGTDCKQSLCSELEDNKKSIAIEEKTSCPPIETPVTPCVCSQASINNKSSLVINEKSSPSCYQNDGCHSSNSIIEDQENLGPDLNLKLEKRKTLKKKLANQSMILDSVVQNHCERLIYCNECNQSFTTKRLLRHHLVSHETSKQPRCYRCRMKYAAYQKHMQTHYHAKTPDECVVCSENFRQYTQPCKRRRIQPETNRRVCKDCDKLIRKKRSFRSHTGFRFLCHICGIHRKIMKDLTKHVKMKHPEHYVELETDGNRHKCPSCPAVLPRYCDLRAHTCDHLAVRNIAYGKDGRVCETCGKILGNEHAYRLHVRVHGLQKDFTCVHCCLKWRSKKKFDCHNAECHNPRHLYKCDSCTMTFEHEEWLEKHKVDAHSSFELLRCETCLEWFSSAVVLSKHESLHKPDTKISCVTYLSHISRAHRKLLFYQYQVNPGAFKDQTELERFLKEHTRKIAAETVTMVVTQRLCDREGTLEYKLEWNNAVINNVAGEISGDAAT